MTGVTYEVVKLKSKVLKSKVLKSKFLKSKFLKSKVLVFRKVYVCIPPWTLNFKSRTSNPLHSQVHFTSSIAPGKILPQKSAVKTAGKRAKSPSIKRHPGCLLLFRLKSKKPKSLEEQEPRGRPQIMISLCLHAILVQ